MGVCQLAGSHDSGSVRGLITLLAQGLMCPKSGFGLNGRVGSGKVSDIS